MYTYVCIHKRDAQGQGDVQRRLSHTHTQMPTRIILGEVGTKSDAQGQGDAQRRLSLSLSLSHTHVILGGFDSKRDAQ